MSIASVFRGSLNEGTHYYSEHSELPIQPKITIVAVTLLFPLGKFLWTSSFILGTKSSGFSVVSRDASTCGQDLEGLGVPNPWVPRQLTHGHPLITHFQNTEHSAFCITTIHGQRDRCHEIHNLPIRMNMISRILGWIERY